MESCINTSFSLDLDQEKKRTIQQSITSDTEHNNRVERFLIAIKSFVLKITHSRHKNNNNNNNNNNDNKQPRSTQLTPVLIILQDLFIHSDKAPQQQHDDYHQRRPSQIHANNNTNNYKRNHRRSYRSNGGLRSTN